MSSSGWQWSKGDKTPEIGAPVPVAIEGLWCLGAAGWKGKGREVCFLFNLVFQGKKCYHHHLQHTFIDSFLFGRPLRKVGCVWKCLLHTRKYIVREGGPFGQFLQRLKPSRSFLQKLLNYQKTRKMLISYFNVKVVMLDFGQKNPKLIKLDHAIMCVLGIDTQSLICNQCAHQCRT